MVKSNGNKGNGRTRPLFDQYAAWRRHNQTGSYKTRETYDQHLQQFFEYCATEFKLEKLCNLESKHMVRYVQTRVEAGLSASTVKLDLSAIRYFVDMYPGIRRPEKFPDNAGLKELLGKALPKRRFAQVDRAWTHEEFDGMYKRAMELGRPKVAYTFALAYSLGLRIHEACQIDHARIIAALKSGEVDIKGKGGLWRQVPLEGMAVKVFEAVIRETRRGDRAFLEAGNDVKAQIRSIQDFIQNHRGGIESEQRQGPRDKAYLDAIEALGYYPHIHFHGLRHSYARRKYRAFRESGMSPHEARRAVAKLLGHGRDDVTRIYLAGENKHTEEHDNDTERTE